MFTIGWSTQARPGKYSDIHVGYLILRYECYFSGLKLAKHREKKMNRFCCLLIWFLFCLFLAYLEMCACAYAK